MFIHNYTVVYSQKIWQFGGPSSQLPTKSTTIILYACTRGYDCIVILVVIMSTKSPYLET